MCVVLCVWCVICVCGVLCRYEVGRRKSRGKAAGMRQKLKYKLKKETKVITNPYFKVFVPLCFVV